MTEIGAEDPLDVIAHENDVAERLVERLGEHALAMQEGRGIVPGEIAEGLRLLGQYRKAHAERVDRVLQPVARPVAMEGCYLHLDTITNDHASEAQAIEHVLEVLQEFAGGSSEAGHRLAQALADLTEKAHDHVEYENDYPLSCLRSALPEEAAARVSDGLHRTDPEMGDLEQHIDRFLAPSPPPDAPGISLRCRAQGCPARAETQLVPSDQGHWAIRVPEGWRLTPRPPIVSRGGTVRLLVDCRCPGHRDRE